MYKANLLPPELKKDVEIDTKKLAILAGATAIVTIIIFAFIGFMVRVYYLEKDLEVKKANIVQLQKIAQKVNETKNEISLLNKEKEAFLELKQKRLVFTVILTDINLNIPKNTWLTEIKYDPATRELSLTGSTREAEEAGIFVYNLNNLPHFSKVFLVHTVRNNTGNYDFSIKAILK
ncbi:hypothetical protein ciss_18740 [Carboxydothermus islandicus]|uniref:Fimbrial assembly protein n=1 Tax=Carboxydothermus islandicus TaxID=661089 RepID=A0A1L8D4E7_9THEO|nr:PilN domain-containing protein [Carboxydothermus islandicus]GAV25941.1 hypothetical protein ciss_18740 [Carboxydothermus islandicus]